MASAAPHRTVEQCPALPAVTTTGAMTAALTSGIDVLPEVGRTVTSHRTRPRAEVPDACKEV